MKREEHRNYCEIMQSLRHIASIGAVPWEWLKEYARESKAIYLTDFVAEAEEVYKNERTCRKG